MGYIFNRTPSTPTPFLRACVCVFLLFVCCPLLPCALFSYYVAGRRLVRQKKAMLRARSSGVMSDIEIHMEGALGDARYQGEIYRRGLTPEDLEAALRRSAADGFKVRRCLRRYE